MPWSMSRRISRNQLFWLRAVHLLKLSISVMWLANRSFVVIVFGIFYIFLKANLLKFFETTTVASTMDSMQSCAKLQVVSGRSSVIILSFINLCQASRVRRLCACSSECLQKRKFYFFVQWGNVIIRFQHIFLFCIAHSTHMGCSTLGNGPASGS